MFRIAEGIVLCSSPEGDFFPWLDDAPSTYWGRSPTDIAQSLFFQLPGAWDLQLRGLDHNTNRFEAHYSTLEGSAEILRCILSVWSVSYVGKMDIGFLQVRTTMRGKGIPRKFEIPM